MRTTYLDALAVYESAKAGRDADRLNAAHGAMTSLYFLENPANALVAPVTVTRLYVVNPATGASHQVVYLAKADAVVLDVGGIRFDGLACNVAPWAQEHGFLVQCHTQQVMV